MQPAATGNRGLDRRGAPAIGTAMSATAAIESIPQADALRLQLAMIVGNEPATSRIEARWCNASGRMSRRWFGVLELDRAVSALRNLRQIGDVFIGVAPRVRDGGKASDVERAWCLWCDLDSREALDRLASFKPGPSIVIETSGDHAHVYWQINRPPSGDWAQRANRRLALALAGDAASTDPARVLRAAGSLNWKHERARPVICTRLELDAYTAADVVAELPDDPRLPAQVAAGRPAGSQLGPDARRARGVRARRAAGRT